MTTINTRKMMTSQVENPKKVKSQILLKRMITRKMKMKLLPMFVPMKVRFPNLNVKRRKKTHHNC